MGFKTGFILFLILAVSWVYVDSRSLSTDRITDMPTDHRVSRVESELPETLQRNEQLCTACEEYTALATNYLKANKTETEIMETLRQACSLLPSFEQQCLLLVDFYGQLFFKEISKIHPQEFCTKFNLCEAVSVSLPEKEDTCTLCHHVVAEILGKLQDPDTQLKILETLLKECKKIEEPYARECKRLVILYGPIILANGEKFLENNDICASIHACKAPRVADKLVVDM